MKRKLLKVTLALMATALVGGVKAQTWDFTKAISTTDQTNISTELVKTDGTEKQNGLWVNNSTNENSWMTNYASSDAELVSTGTTVLEFTKGLYFTATKNNVRLWQQESKKYIQMRDGVKIKIKNLKKGQAITIAAQMTKADYTLSYDSDDMTEVSRTTSSTNVTVVSTVKADGDVSFTINHKTNAETPAASQLHVNSIRIDNNVQTETTKTTWNFTSWDATDLTNLNADAPAGVTDGDKTTFSDGTYWKHVSNENRYYNVNAISDTYLVAKNGENIVNLNSPAAIKFTAAKNGSVRIYNESSSKYLYLAEGGTDGATNNFKISLTAGQTLTVHARSGSGSNSASIVAKSDANIITVSGNATTGTYEDYVFYAKADGEYTFYPSSQAMFIQSITIKEHQLSTRIGSFGYATFSSPVSLDLTQITDGAKAYYVADADNSTVTLTEATGIVPANTGLILKSSGATDVVIASIPATTIGTAIDGNKLVAVTENNTLVPVATSSAMNYVLGVQSGKVVFAPIQEETPTLNAGQSYLHVEGVSGARALSLSFGNEDETTGIA
ncbi:MAG: hypothetical protein IJM84_06290, partial [Bacteroidaceae bacterium]|nr:hypothetical protein [Bacteroidaceae bacterium]